MQKNVKAKAQKNTKISLKQIKHDNNLNINDNNSFTKSIDLEINNFQTNSTLTKTFGLNIKTEEKKFIVISR